MILALNWFDSFCEGWGWRACKYHHESKQCLWRRSNNHKKIKASLRDCPTLHYMDTRLTNSRPRRFLWHTGTFHRFFDLAWGSLTWPIQVRRSNQSWSLQESSLAHSTPTNTNTLKIPLWCLHVSFVFNQTQYLLTSSVVHHHVGHLQLFGRISPLAKRGHHGHHGEPPTPNEPPSAIDPGSFEAPPEAPRMRARYHEETV